MVTFGLLFSAGSLGQGPPERLGDAEGSGPIIGPIPVPTAGPQPAGKVVCC